MFHVWTTLDILKPPASGTCMQGFKILPAQFKAMFSYVQVEYIDAQCVIRYRACSSCCPVYSVTLS